MPVSISGQVVIIVGASSGIGRAAAMLFAREGSRVVAAARREDRLQVLKEELAKDQREITVRRADASNPEDMQQLARETLQHFGRVDILVFASGINTRDRAMDRLTPEVWNSLVAVNLNGAFYATHAVLSSMRSARSGHLIYISSISGVITDVSVGADQAQQCARQCRLAAAGLADDAERLAAVQIKAYVLERPDPYGATAVAGSIAHAQLAHLQQRRVGRVHSGYSSRGMALSNAWV